MEWIFKKLVLGCSGHLNIGWPCPFHENKGHKRKFEEKLSTNGGSDKLLCRVAMT